MASIYNPFDRSAQQRPADDLPPALSNILPDFWEQTPRGERATNVYTKLFQERIIFIGTPIDSRVANNVIGMMLYLQSENPDRDITLYVNSPGGEVYAGLAIYDTMQYIKPDISTVCVGMAMSFGAVLLAAGTKGKRYCLPHSYVLIHQPWLQGGLGGQVTDIEIHAKHMIEQRSILNQILAKHTGQPLERIQTDTDRDFFMTAQQAVEYGLVDEILTRQEEMALSR